jgi:PAS domain S-box-containing protein
MRTQRLFLGFSFATLALISAASIALDAKSQSDADQVARTLEVTNKLSNLRLPMRVADIAQRGYLLTGEDRFLDDYRSAIALIMPALAELATATADNPAQQDLLAVLKPKLAHKLAMLEEPIALRASGGSVSAPALVAAGPDRALMESIAPDLDRIGAEEQRLLQLRSAASGQTRTILFAVDLSGAAAILLFASVFLVLVRRSNQSRAAAFGAVNAANTGLEAAFAERTELLRLANEEIERSAIILGNSAIVVNNTISCMAEAVMVIDEQRAIMLANAAATRLFGYNPGMSAEQWTKLTSLFLVDGETPLPPDQRPMARALRGEQFDGVEVVMRRSDTTDRIHVVASGRPLIGELGTIKGAVLVYHDVTEARETERQLRQAQKMDAMGQLTGGIAHDFNNMLTVITGTIDILASGVAHDPELAGIAKLIDQATQRGAEMTAHLLAFARKQPLQPDATDVNALIVETTKLLAAVGAQIEIELMLDDEAWPALVDPGQLATALLNLSLNARDAMPGGGKLTLESRNVHLDEAYARSNVGVVPGPYLMVAVSDSGTGIPPAIRDQVFEPFFTTKEVGKGTGLGLSMVYGFIKQSNGHIKIDSEVGHGTTIKIYLPRASEPADSAAGAASPAAAECGSETILVVEDDAMVLAFVVTTLESLGYTAIAAANAAAALAIVEQGTAFDLLFTDVIMPGMNGGLLAAEIQTLRPRVKVLFTSGYTDNVITHKGRLDPGVLLLTKPYRKPDLARMVRSALDQAPAAVARKTAKRLRKARVA